MSIDKKLLWTGIINDGARIGGSVGLYDTTLRDGEQTPGVVFDARQKLAIAQAIDSLGIARIEAGFPRVSEEDYDAVKLISEAGLKAEVWAFSRAVVADVEVLVDLGVKHTVIESPVSDLKLNAYGVSREKMLERIRASVSFAVGEGITVAYFGVDGTRAEDDFLEQAYKTAIDAGATEAVGVDTVGIAGPEAVEAFVAKICGWLGPEVPVHFHGHDDFGLSTASAVAAVRGGARWVQGTINGMGERAGNANLLTVALALEAVYGIETGFVFERAREVSRMVRELSGYPVEAWKPVVGENLFRRESGAVASQFHDPPSIEPFAADLVGAKRSIVLGKKSGLDSVRIKAEELGLDISDEQRASVLAAVKELGMQKRGLVSDQEFREFVQLGT
ncbi:MAG TPA: hypothetical protein VIL77_15385 [Gaiellaceae bacterium]